MLETVERGDLWIADRNFCTLSLIFDMHRRAASFVLRQHGCLKGRLLDGRRRIGKIEAEIVHEQALAVTDPESDVELILR